MTLTMKKYMYIDAKGSSKAFSHLSASGPLLRYSKVNVIFPLKKKINFLLKSSEWCLLTRISHCTHSSSIFLIFSMYFNFFLNDDKGFPFYGVTLTYADSAVLNLAQLATWAEFKNVQNLHKSTYRHRKKTL